jgi:hypothetical protein
MCVLNLFQSSEYIRHSNHATMCQCPLPTNVIESSWMHAYTCRCHTDTDDTYSLIQICNAYVLVICDTYQIHAIYICLYWIHTNVSNTSMYLRFSLSRHRFHYFAIDSTIRHRFHSKNSSAFTPLLYVFVCIVCICIHTSELSTHCRTAPNADAVNLPLLLS